MSPEDLGPDKQERRRPEIELAESERTRRRPRSSRKVPLFRFLAFYAALIGVGVVLAQLSPVVRHAWVTSPVLGQPAGRSLLEAEVRADPLTSAVPGRIYVTALIVIGALALSVPVAWIYTFTRRLRYDPSLVQSVIILPAVVAGIVVVVKNSVALAFSLAGIVAAVRFRNTLKDPKDAVYIFLALGIGLAAGVQALDIALVLSLIFNLMVLVLWKWDLGAIYSEGGRDLLSVGDPMLRIAHSSRQREALRWRMEQAREGMQTDGILLVHTDDVEKARRGVELALSKAADEWKIVEGFRRRNGVSTFAVLMELNAKQGDPLALLDELDERWSAEVQAAEYIPFKMAAEEKS